MPIASCRTLATGARQFVVHDALEMTLCGPVVGLVEVDAERDGDVLVLGRRGDDDLLGPGLEVLGGVVALGEQAGGLDHHVDAEVAPRQVAGSRSASTRIGLAVDGDALVAVLDGAGDTARGRVVPEQVRQRRRRR